MSRFVPVIAGLLLLASSFPFAGARATPRDEDLFKRPIDDRVVIFGSADAGSSYFLSAGSKQALVAPLDRPGFLSMESTGIGLTRERLRIGDIAVPVERFIHQGSALFGYQTMYGPLYVAGYVGPEFHHEQVAYAGQLARFSQPRLGIRGQAEIWYHPTPDTLVTATAVAGSARSSVWLRGSLGFRIWEKAFLGPEIVTYTTPTYRETRWGLHLTGPAIGIVNLRLSAGAMTDDGRRHVSPYAGLSAWIRL